MRDKGGRENGENNDNSTRKPQKIEYKVCVCVCGCGVLGIDKRAYRSSRFRERWGVEVYRDSLILCINILHLEARDDRN